MSCASTPVRATWRANVTPMRSELSRSAYASVPGPSTSRKAAVISRSIAAYSGIATASPDAALHIGPQFVILETAAADLAAQVAGTDRLQGQSEHVMFLARGKTGPFRVDGEPMTGTDGTVAVRVLIHDEGAGDRAITAGSYVFSREA